MQNVGHVEKALDFLLPKVGLTFAATLTLLILCQPTSFDKKDVVKNPTFHVEFSKFSPAFAAFEDEFLFEEQKQMAQLQAGESPAVFNNLNQPEVSVHVAQKKSTKKASSKSIFAQFDGEEIQSHWRPKKAFAATKSLKNKPSSVAAIQNEELRNGSLVAMVMDSAKSTLSPRVHSNLLAPKNNSPAPKKSKKDVTPYDGDDQKLDPRDKYRVRGTIQLRDGLAFIGAMEISWVVDDYELKRGSIDTRDGTFDIETTDMIGQIIVSLYDTDGELNGEGFIDLMDFTHKKGEVNSNINVYPINWDQAGMVYDGSSVGSGVHAPVEGVEVALYSFNEAATTTSKGEFNFPDWKKSNSKTLAIASKPGYRESIFLLDSNKKAQVLLLDNKYVESLFFYLDSIGRSVDKYQGLIYGQLTGAQDLSDYKVSIEGQQAIFIENGFANPERTSTSASGLFTFVDLQDGDYELFVEKDGEVIDRRVLVVEQGKISPLLINLSHSQKFIEFIDPLDPDRQVTSIEVNFFDGASELTLNNNRAVASFPGGHDSALIDLNTPIEATRTFASRDRKLQVIPLLNQSLHDLINQSGMKLSDGLVVGFVDGEDPFLAHRVEGDVQNTIYFSERGEMIDPRVQKASGFIMNGFSQGLSSIALERLSDGMIMTSDLVFSDHQSISIVNIKTF